MVQRLGGISAVFGLEKLFWLEEGAVNQKNGQVSILLNNLCLQNDLFMSD